MLRTDLYDRALPWSALILEDGELPADLNLRSFAASGRAAGGAGSGRGRVAARAGDRRAWWWVAAAIAVVAASLAANRDLVAFFAAKRGVAFALGGWLFHQVHLLIAAGAFLFASLRRPRAALLDAALEGLTTAGATTMLRFVFVTTFYPPHHFGGDAVLVRHMAEALVRAGHDVDVIYDVGRLPGAAIEAASDPAAPRRRPNGVRVHALRSRLGLLSPLLTHQLGRPVVHRRAIERLLRGGVDVVHYHNVSLVGGPGVLRYGDALKLYTAHEHWLVCPTHVLWRHDREPCAGRECLRCLAHYRRPPQLWRWSGLLERSARHVDAFCSPSRFSIDKHREFGFERPMTLLPPFLPDETTTGDARPAAPAARRRRRPPMFLFVGRLERIKGLDDVIPLFSRRDGTAELWIAGDGTHEARAAPPRRRRAARALPGPGRARRGAPTAARGAGPGGAVGGLRGVPAGPARGLSRRHAGDRAPARSVPRAGRGAGRRPHRSRPRDELRAAIDRLATDRELGAPARRQRARELRVAVERARVPRALLRADRDAGASGRVATSARSACSPRRCRREEVRA